MTLRPALPEDTPALAALHAASFVAPWGAQEIADLLAGPGGFGLVIEAANGSPAGFILCRVVVGEAEVLTLAVAPETRGQGLGRVLMQAALGLARTAGAETMFLEVAADNAPALALYRGLGFERIGLRPGYYAHGGRGPIDALVYRLSLNAPT
ncbi:ribosomal protein S18-alanine N-acetyltransferase [Phenylobacterium montanum]|uniref:[Ribosomal protein bS18]-alanine N-acetyltransferase n=1 Tax=Phenylobacterium montanum TaxID=2823693 RepID=A0A975FW99_9CAUL|nr:ribosomal protein S18-alanine N-acetyltransferase [Caulobacter sp. S6]QUD86434.1 ribosomal protein S18-alanine N-acetyltransferase [Caulobacter sp. S6]